MRRHETVTAFFLETLLLIGAFILVILALTRVFAAGRVMSEQARSLTSAVTLAQNAAEAVSAADSPETAAALLDEGGNVRIDGDRIRADYDRDMRPVPAPGALQVEITWAPDGDGLVNSRITVRAGDGTRTVYTLDTAVYTGEVPA